MKKPRHLASTVGITLRCAAWCYVLVLPQSRGAELPSLVDRLAQPVSIAWENRPLRDGLARLAETQKVAIWLDRRVDPGLPQNLSLQQVSLEVALKAVAENNELGSAMVGEVIYVGPMNTAKKLRTLSMLHADEVKKLPEKSRAKLLAKRSWNWPDLSDPTQLLEPLLIDGGVTATNSKRVAHDLWLGRTLPPLTWTDRMTLLLAQFGETYEWRTNGQTIEIVPIPDAVEVERHYAFGAKAAGAKNKLLELFPDANIELKDSTLIVRGTAEVQDAADLLARGRTVHKTDLRQGEQQYTLRLQEIPLQDALAGLGPKLGVKFEWDESALEKAHIDMTQRVSLDVQKVTLDQLIARLLSDTNLTYQRSGNTLRLKPK